MNRRKLKQAYIRGMIDCTVWILTMTFYVQIGIYAYEKYFI